MLVSYHCTCPASSSAIYIINTFSSPLTLSPSSVILVLTFLTSTSSHTRLPISAFPLGTDTVSLILKLSFILTSACTYSKSFNKSSALQSPSSIPVDMEIFLISSHVTVKATIAFTLIFLELMDLIVRSSSCALQFTSSPVASHDRLTFSRKLSEPSILTGINLLSFSLLPVYIIANTSVPSIWALS